MEMDDLRAALGRLMRMRETARRFGRDVACKRDITRSLAMPGRALVQVLDLLAVDERRALTQWLTRQGPFWDRTQQHDSGDYLTCRDEIVTDSGVGEAAHCLRCGLQSDVLSFFPSTWNVSPLEVICQTDDAVAWVSRVANFWDDSELASYLASTPIEHDTWESLAVSCRRRFASLEFAPDAFEPMQGHPYVRAIAVRIVELLTILERFAQCFDDTGERTPEGHDLYQQYFTGDTAHFSDSSSSEKADFASKLTFRHPTVKGGSIDCSWHGKISTGQRRIHFSWPIRALERPYVAYVGPKLTRR